MERATKKVETEQDAESIEEVDTSDRVGTSGKGGRVKKDRADQKKEVGTRKWSDVVKGLQTDDKLETTESVEWFDSDEPNQVKAKRTGRQPKPTPKRRIRRVEKRQYRDNDGAEMGLMSRQTDCRGRDAGVGWVKMHGVGWVKKRWTGGVVERRTEPDEGCEQGEKTLGEAEARNWQIRWNLSLSLRGSVEKQAQHGPMGRIG